MFRSGLKKHLDQGGLWLVTKDIMKDVTHHRQDLATRTQVCTPVFEPVTKLPTADCVKLGVSLAAVLTFVQYQCYIYSYGGHITWPHKIHHLGHNAHSNTTAVGHMIDI